MSSINQLPPVNVSGLTSAAGDQAASVQGGRAPERQTTETIDAWYETHNDEAARGRDNEMSKREVRAFREDDSLTDEQQDIADFVFDNRKVFDRDGNGRLNRDEFHRAVQAAERQVDLPTSSDANEAEKINEFYERFNDEAAKGRDNEMSKREMRAFYEDASLSSEDRAVAQFIFENRKTLDVDGNSRLSRDEFFAAFDEAVSQDLKPVSAPPPSSDSRPPSSAKSLEWGGEDVKMWDITQQNVDDDGIANGADAFLVTVNDTSISRVERMAEEYGFDVVETAGKSDAGVLLLRPTSESKVEGLDKIINYGKTTIVAVDGPDGKVLVPDGGGFETRPKNQMGFGTTDNTSTKGGVFHSDGGNAKIIKNGEDDVRVWDKDNMVSKFRGGWMGLEWRSA